MKPFYLLFFAFIPITAFSQKRSLDCETLKNGTFFLYPKNSTEKYTWNRNGNQQFETNLVTGDSTVYSVKWSGECGYSLKLVKTSEKLKPEAKQFLDQHEVYYEIVEKTSDYYLFKAHVDKPSGMLLQTDTVWLKEKQDYVAGKLFEYLKDTRVLKKQKFSDTSQYAVLYIYRSGKFAGSGVSVQVFFDNTLMCVISNNSAYAFKILKDGQHLISSKVVEKGKTIVDQKLDIEFGKKYYLKTTLKFSVSLSQNSYLPGFILDPKDAAIDFESVPYGG